jgi:hypothetical protein
MKMNHLPAPKKQTQTNPIQTQFLQRPKSLAGKSGHTPMAGDYDKGL